jgi:hypothetical protein
MPVIAEATAQARLIAHRGANVAAVLIGASFHPFRTVREGASVVRGLVNPPEEPIQPPPTDAQEQSPAAKDSTSTGSAGTKAAQAAPPTTAKKTASKKTAAEKPAKKTAQKTAQKSTKKDLPGPDTVAKPAAPPPAPDGADRPVQARGPAPHMPPSIAGEVERDFGDELPGITPGED